MAPTRRRGRRREGRAKRRKEAFGSLLNLLLILGDSGWYVRERER
jgi:hypothetical protein